MEVVNVKFDWCTALLIAIISMLASPLHARAALALQQSRVIFNGDNSSASLLVNNQNPSAPYLAQGWIEDEAGRKVRRPLLVLPPLQRIEPGASSQVKIQALPDANLLRQDRETLFYVNLREIPPRNERPNTFNIALQNRIKLFYRPAALKAAPGELASPWLSQLVLEKQGESWRISNPSAYYVTLVEARGFSAFRPLMLAPGVSAPLPGVIGNYGSTPVLTYLNDYGGRPEVIFGCAETRCTVTANRVPRG